VTRTERTQWASENSAYLNRLLSERHPGYLAALRAAEREVDRELSRAAAENQG
jgi:hypothetical protein